MHARRDAARGAPHVAGGDVAPPAVVEAERDEDRELDRDDDEDRVDHQPVVRLRHALVETQPERQPPGDGDQHGVREQLPEPMPVDGNHEAHRCSGLNDRDDPLLSRRVDARPDRHGEVLQRELFGDRQRAAAVVEIRKRGLQMERGRVVDGTADPRLLQSGADPVSLEVNGRRTGGRRDRARPREARRRHRDRARRNDLPPRGARQPSRRAPRGRCATRPPGSRRGASCSRSARSRPCRVSRGSGACERVPQALDRRWRRARRLRCRRDSSSDRS